MVKCCGRNGGCFVELADAKVNTFKAKGAAENCFVMSFKSFIASLVVSLTSTFGSSLINKKPQKALNFPALLFAQIEVRL